MPGDVWIGIGGAALMAAGVLLRRKVRGRRAKLLPAGLVIFGWMLVGQFLIKPLVPTPVVAGILLGGLSLGILLTAVIGGRAHSSGKSADGTSPSANARNVGARQLRRQLHVEPGHRRLRRPAVVQGDPRVPVAGQHHHPLRQVPLGAQVRRVQDRQPPADAEQVIERHVRPAVRRRLARREGVERGRHRAAVAQAQQLAELEGQPDAQLAAGVGERAGVQGLAGAGVPEGGLELIEPGHAGECDRLER